ncbi:hypothetical protein [Mycobacterium sp. MMS18-G62]
MSETPTSSEPATGPVVTAPPPAYVEPQRRSSRLNVVAAWVGIVAGVVFIVATIFFTGFFLGAHSGGHRGGHPGDGEVAIFHKGGLPPMMPMGPGMGPGGQFQRPAPPFGPGGPGFEPAPTQSPGAPTTTAPSRP